MVPVLRSYRNPKLIQKACSEMIFTNNAKIAQKDHHLSIYNPQPAYHKEKLRVDNREVVSMIIRIHAAQL